MIKFDALNLPKTDSDTYPFEGDELISAGADEPCLVCGDPTHWVSLSFEAPFCSDECLRGMWQGYEAAQAQFNDLPTPESGVTAIQNPVARQNAISLQVGKGK